MVSTGSPRSRPLWPAGCSRKRSIPGLLQPGQERWRSHGPQWAHRNLVREPWRSFFGCGRPLPVPVTPASCGDLCVITGVTGNAVGARIPVGAHQCGLLVHRSIWKPAVSSSGKLLLASVSCKAMRIDSFLFPSPQSSQGSVRKHHRVLTSFVGSSDRPVGSSSAYPARAVAGLWSIHERQFRPHEARPPSRGAPYPGPDRSCGRPWPCSATCRRSTSA
jgi:hypothetical protein